MNVLIYVPCAPATPKIYARTIQSIFRMRWDYPVDIVFGREDWPEEEKYQNITKKYNHARDMLLQGSYDALLTVENDMVIPEDALEKLSRVPADVAYGLYCSRHGQHKWLAFMSIWDGGGVSVSDLGKDEMIYMWDKVMQTRGVGLGCTLIHRRVLEKIAFRVDPEQTAQANDWYLALDVDAAGFTQAHDFTVRCGHIMGDLAKIVWCDAQEPYGIRYEFMNVPDKIPVANKEIVVDRIGYTVLDQEQKDDNN